MLTRVPTSSHDRSNDNDSDGRGVSRGPCGDGRCGGDGGAAAARPVGAAEELSVRRAESRGLLWLVGGFLLCPCHLPLTLGLLAALLAGTTAGALLREHGVAAAAVVTAAWGLATWRGLRLLRAGRRSVGGGRA
jgi:mercuric ion transport protein